MNNGISYKHIWRISYPIILGGVAQNIVNVTDTAFLGRLGEVPLAAAGNGGIFYLVLIMTGLGFATGGEILIGRRNGENNYPAIGRIFSHLLYCLSVFSILFFLLTKFGMPNLIEAISKSKDIAENTIKYLDYRAYGIFFSFFNFAFRAFYVGITRTKILIANTALMSLVNVILDYVLIFGKFGFPEMGIEGAALASVISELVASAHFMFFTTRMNHKKYTLFEFTTFDSQLFKKIGSIATPIMIRNLISISSWLIFFLIIEQVGERELAVSHIARSFYMVLIIPLWGFSTATSTLVSNYIGKGLLDEVSTIIKKVSLLSLASTLIFVPFNLFLPEQIVSIYTNNPELIAETVPTLKIIAGSMLIFSVAYIIFSGVLGTGDRKAILAIEGIATSLYLIITYLFALHYKLSIELVWCSEYLYFGLMGVLSVFYIQSGRWKTLNI